MAEKQPTSNARRSKAAFNKAIVSLVAGLLAAACAIDPGAIASDFRRLRSALRRHVPAKSGGADD